MASSPEGLPGGPCEDPRRTRQTERPCFQGDRGHAACRSVVSPASSRRGQSAPPAAGWSVGEKQGSVRPPTAPRWLCDLGISVLALGL